MRSIIIKFRDGTEQLFKEKGRAGGSYTISIKYEPGFVIVEDEYNNQNIFPSDIIKEILTESDYRSW